MDSSSRRGSTLTLIDSNDIINGRNFDQRFWFDHYLSVIKGQTACELTTGHLTDVLKLLYDDTISDLILVHLLNLMEQRVDLLDDQQEVLEQVVGTLLNFYSNNCSNNGRPQVRKKILSTSTALFVYQSSLVIDSLQTLLQSFIKLLRRETSSSDELMRILSRESLSALYDVFLDLIDPLDPVTASNILPVEDVKNRLIRGQQLGPDVTPEILQHALYDVVQLVKEDPDLTPAIFKPFISQFCFSSELYHVHFLIILLREFRLQLFTDQEEEMLLQQLVVLSKHQSLLVSHRLFALDFVCSLMKDFPDAFDPQSFYPTEFDGPDTVEKKLKILIQFPSNQLSDEEFLLWLQPLQSLSLERDHNTRATKSLYRVLSVAMTHRESLMSRVEGIVICLIIASPRHHIRYSLDLMNHRPDLAKRVAVLILKKVLSSGEALAKDVADLEQLFVFMEWLLIRQLVSRSDEGKSVEQLFKFLYEKSISNVCLVPLLLSCAAAAVRSYDLTDGEKELLRNILSFVSREAKNNVTLTSWAQIYSIAITALSGGVENIRHVFDTEDLSSLRTQAEDHFLTSDECPVQLNRRRTPISTLGEKDMETCNEETKFTIEFDVSLAAFSRTEQVFALCIEVRSIDQEFYSCWQTPLLSVRKSRLMKLELQLKHSQPFDLLFDCQFNDLNGVVYMSKSFHMHHISFCDILSPLEAVYDVKSFCQLRQQIASSISECLETVIRLKSIPDCDTLLNQHPFLRDFCIKTPDPNRLFMAPVMPKSRILLTSKVIADRVNLHAMTDDPDSLLLLRRQLSP